MLVSIGLIILVGLFIATVFKYLKLPRMIGMLLVGIVLGPQLLHVLDHGLLAISADIRKMALIIILIKAGLTLNLQDLKQVGRPALLLSFVPALFELFGYIVLAPILLGISLIEAALMGTVLAAVSPAVVVPRMVDLIEKGYGIKKSIPQMILAGVSLDDVFVIVLFSSFLLLNQGKEVSVLQLINIPSAIIFGIVLGIVAGYGLNHLFTMLEHKQKLSVITKSLLILAVSFVLIGIESYLHDRIAVSALLAILVLAATLKSKSKIETVKQLANQFGQLWYVGELFLFVLVGAAVDVQYMLQAGFVAVLLIVLALVLRTIGVLISTVGTALTWKERVFCVFAYLPKATVQAAIGAVPLSIGLASGSLILSVAVLSIVLTAPVGAFLIDSSYKLLLER